MTKAEMIKKIQNGEWGGLDLNCADLRGADLSRTDLRGADLICADLSDADLRGTNLSRADLRDTDLSGADLSGADLSCADLSGADLSCADLSGADLICAYLSGADLRGANLSRADLSCADLRDTDLSGADLRGANLSRARADLSDICYNERTAFLSLCCPEEGSFVGYKKCQENKIVKLLITEDAKRSSATTRKCRASKVKVLSIENVDGTKSYDEAVSIHSNNFIYCVGKIIEVKDFDEDRWKECATGIHFFITRDEAVRYNF